MRVLQALGDAAFVRGHRWAVASAVVGSTPGTRASAVACFSP